jgi:hypothetical protein
VIKAKYDGIEQARLDKIASDEARVLRKAERRKKRDIRQKDFELEKYKDQIQRNVILRGEVVDVLQTNLSEYHGFLTNEKYIGAVGGQLQQVYYVIEEIFSKYPNDLKTYMEKQLEANDTSYFEKPNNLRELMQPEHLNALLMQYLKQMKNESFDLFLHPICQRFLDERETSYDDLTTLSEEDFVEFVTIFKGNKSRSHRQLREATVDGLLEFLLKVLAKQEISEKTKIKLDQIQGKVRLVPLPEGRIEEDFVETFEIDGEDGAAKEETVERAANVKHNSVVYIKVGQCELEDE